MVKHLFNQLFLKLVTQGLSNLDKNSSGGKRQTKHWSYLQSCIPPRLAYLLPKPFELFTLTYLHRLCRNSTFSVIKECGLAKKYGQ